MDPSKAPSPAEVFISYSSNDRNRVLDIADQLESAEVNVWIDRHKIPGGTNYGSEIVRGIRDCKVLMLMCSDASMRSRNVKQEIQLAWKYERPYLPLLIEPIAFPEQVVYWLEGWQWIEVLERPPREWLPSVMQSLRNAGVECRPLSSNGMQAELTAPSIHLNGGLDGLLSVSRFTDQIWTLPAEHTQRSATRSVSRDLGALQDNVQHGFQVGSRVCLAIEAENDGHLLLLDRGTSRKIYCLCPSRFAPDTRLHKGLTYLPQEGSPHDSFAVTGNPGREELIAIITGKPLGLDWMPSDPKIPARVLSETDIDLLLARLHDLEGNRWTALSTYFDIVT